MLQDKSGGIIELFLDTDTSSNQLFQKPINHMGLRVENVTIAYQQALAAGATSVMSPTNVEGEGLKVEVAFVLGPNGERIELIRYKK